MITNSQLGAVEANIKASFAKIKDELDEHLDAINQGTSEIQSNYEYLIELESKVDKLSEKMDQILMLLEQKSVPVTFTVQPLTLREQEIVAAIYANEPITLHTIVQRVGLPESMVIDLIAKAQTKGVLINCEHSLTHAPMYKLDSAFKEAQAKHNILTLNQKVFESVIE